MKPKTKERLREMEEQVEFAYNKVFDLLNTTKTIMERGDELRVEFDEAKKLWEDRAKEMQSEIDDLREDLTSHRNATTARLDSISKAKHLAHADTQGKILSRTIQMLEQRVNNLISKQNIPFVPTETDTHKEATDKAWDVI